MTQRKLFLCVTVFLVILAAFGADGADWPMCRADAQRSGYSPDSLAQELALRWTYQARTPRPAWPTSGRITFDLANQPIIVGESVILGNSADDSVTVLDIGSGQQRWCFWPGGPIRFAPVAWQDRVFVASDDGYLYALALRDGRLLWKHRGGPNDRKCMGNGRMISRWPARGGPVVFGDVVYYAAGIWPSNGVYLHALQARTGQVIWTNDTSGGLYMPQPHGGANAYSGVTPQGYLLATEERIFVPTGRAVPAAFRRSDGALEYYRLQQNGSMGGSRALVADRFVVNGGCFLERATGRLEARAGRGVFGATADGMVRFTGKALQAYRWADLEQPDRRGKPVRYRGLREDHQVVLGDDSFDQRRVTRVLDQLPALRDLYRTQIRFREAADNVAKQTGLERTLSQARPDVEALQYDVAPFLATSYEREHEVIVAGEEAICGGPGTVHVVGLAAQRPRWSYHVRGNALGLAVAGGQLIVTTSLGQVYCFGPPVPQSEQTKRPTRQSIAQAHTVRSTKFAAAAEEILRIGGVCEGLCIDLGCGVGELALELAKRSRLQVVGIESEMSKVEEARRMLQAAGVYGTRVTIHQGDPKKPPYPRYCANLIVSSRRLSEPATPLDETEIQRLQRPYGGVVCLRTADGMQVQRRGGLPGAGRWTHQNSNAANTLCSADRIARGPLEIAWYRDGVLEIPDRHAQGPAPLFNRGCLVVEGVHGICAVDAYNGHTLWTYSIPDILADWDGVHHDVGIGDTGSNFCLSDEAVFVRTQDHCLKLDLATGVERGDFKTPVPASASDRNWGYVACEEGILFGSVLNDKHTVSPRYQGIRLRTESVLLFAMDAKTGKLKWQYRPQHSIRNNAIAVAGGRVYLIDRPLAGEDRILNPVRNGKHRPLLKPGEHPGGTLLALDAKTGSTLWKSDEDVFGTQLAVSQEHGILLTYYQGVKHKFFKLPSELGGRLAAFDVATGKRRWDRAADYKTRPLINEKTIYAEGGAWDLLSGEPVPWQFERSYGCGQIAASTHLMLFRSATLGYLDLTRNAGTENFGGIRTSCWFNAIPAGGMVLVPDGSAKCACSYQMQAWLALQEREDEQ